MIIPLITENAAALTAADLEQPLAQHGIVSIRHGAHSSDDFLTFSDRLGEGFISHSLSAGNANQRVIGGNSGRSVVKGEQSLFSTTGLSYDHEVLVHGELYFQQVSPPGKLWFHCEQAALTQGQTIFCDGIELFAQLPDDIQQLLLASKLVYQREHDLVTWNKLYRTESVEELIQYCQTQDIELQVHENQSITTRFVSKAVIMHEGEPVFINNFLPFAHRQLYKPEETRAKVMFESGAPVTAALFNAINAQAQALSVLHEWQAGDMVIVNNKRMLHGRNKLDGSARKVYVRMSQN